ncbi:MAG: hypothetical protein ACP5KN_01905 [Armatimonadota bacterium]
MRRLTISVAIGLLLVPCLAMAQYGMEEYEKTSEVRVRAGWFDMGDAGDGLGVGVDYAFEAWNQEWMAGLEWGDADGGPPAGETDGGGIDTCWGATFNWIGRSGDEMAMREQAELYYGAGVGWYNVDNSSSDDSLGAQVLVGADFASDWFGELRWVFGTDVLGGDVDGIRAAVGFRFK